MKQLIALVLISLLVLSSCVKTNSLGHSCQYGDYCPMIGLTVFENKDVCDYGSDCYKLDSIHFTNPGLEDYQEQDILDKMDSR